MKTSKKFLFFLALLAALSPTLVLATEQWTGVDNFDSYSVGDNLDNLNGGSGWGTAWTKSGTGVAKIVAAPAGHQGGNAVSSTNAMAYWRDLVAAGGSTTTMSIWVWIDTTSPGDDYGFYMRSAAGGSAAHACYVTLAQSGQTGKVTAYNGSSYVPVGDFTANTWFNIMVQIDPGDFLNTFRVAVNGQWSSQLGCDGAFSSWWGVTLQRGSGVANMYFDDINFTSSSPVTAQTHVIFGEGVDRNSTSRP